MRHDYKLKGFTIVELLVVVVVIAILAAITIVSYNGITKQAIISTMKQDLASASKQLEVNKITSGGNIYPPDSASAGLKASGDNVLQYTPVSNAQGYCLSVVSPRLLSETFSLEWPSGQTKPGLCADHVAANQNPNIWSAIAAGTQHRCGIYSSRAYCWGVNWSGGLGTGTNEPASAPAQVSTTGVLNGKNISAIAVSSDDYNTSCAVADGSVYCWGYGMNGGLGNGSTASNSNVPVAVATNTGLSGKTVTKLSYGAQHACVIASGQVYCWGSTPGNASASNTSSPTVVGGLLAGKTVTDISAGVHSTCAVADGRAYCWGSNSLGKLGNGTTTASVAPVAVDTSGVLLGKTITSVSSGDQSSCAVSEQRAYCWGRGEALGINSSSDSLFPVAVLTSGDLSGKAVESVIAGDRAACALAEGSMYCWGSMSPFTPLSPHLFVPTGAHSGDTVTAYSLDFSGKYCAIANNTVRCN